MAKNQQAAEQSPKARKLATDRLVIDDTKIAITFQTESEAEAETVELIAMNPETGDQFRLQLANSTKELAASGRTGTRWRNVSRTTPEEVANEIPPGEWRCHLLLDGEHLFRPSPPDGILDEPITIAAEFCDLTFSRSPIGLLLLEIERRKPVPVQDLIVTATKITSTPDHAMRIVGMAELLGKPFSGVDCELEIRVKKSGTVLKAATVTPVDGKFRVLIPTADLPLGMHDIYLRLPQSDTSVRVRFPEALDGGDPEPIVSDERQGARAYAYRSRNGHFVLRVTPASDHFEITKIQATQTAFVIAGVVAGTSEDERTVKKVLNEYECYAIGRDTGDEIELGVILDESTFHIKFAPQSLPDIDFGVWDIAMKSTRGDVSYLARNPDRPLTSDERSTAVICSSVSGAAAAISCQSDTSDRITISVQPLLRGSQLRFLAVGNSIEAEFEITTRDVPVDDLFVGCVADLLIAFGPAAPHRVPAMARFSATGPHTCRIHLTCGLGGAESDKLRRALSQCTLGILFKGPNIDGIVPIDADATKFFAKGLRAAVEAPWTTVLAASAAAQLYGLSSRLGIRNENVVLQCADGDYGGNARAISETLTARAPQLKKIWAVDDPDRFVDNASKTVRPGSFAHIWHLARARYFVGDATLPAYARKRPSAVHVQTGLADFTGEASLNPQTLARWDIVLSPSGFASKQLRQSLNFKGVILENGNPRNDVLTNAAARQAIADRVRAALGIHPNKRVVLYAPSEHDRRPPISLRTLNRALGSDHVLLLRLPPDVANGFEWLSGYEGFAINVSRYETLTNLICAADVFVTDTSSAMVDFALTGKPMIFYMRDTYGIDPAFVDHAPGPIVHKQMSLTRALFRLDKLAERFAAQYQEFVATYCAQERGNATDVAVSKLLNISRKAPL